MLTSGHPHPSASLTCRASWSQARSHAWGSPWGEDGAAGGVAVVEGQKGIHQRGLCQRLNFLYFRTGSYLNYFIDFLFPCKSSLSRAEWLCGLQGAPGPAVPLLSSRAGL